MVENKREGSICKLDIEKAYDNINWQFLLKVLQKNGLWVKVVGVDVELLIVSQIFNTG